MDEKEKCSKCGGSGVINYERLTIRCSCNAEVTVEIKCNEEEENGKT